MELDRPMLRPNVDLKKILIVFFCWEIAISAFSLLSFFTVTHFFSLHMNGFLLFFLMDAAVHVVLVFVRFKNVIITVVLLYQRYAPYPIRERCTFIPSCSEYMILAIEKYGAFKGFRMGVSRLFRCGCNTQTEDWP